MHASKLRRHVLAGLAVVGSLVCAATPARAGGACDSSQAPLTRTAWNGQAFRWEPGRL